MAYNTLPDANGNNESVMREAAEDQLAQSPDVKQDLKDKTPEEIIHELQVHQIELEMQNDELHRAQEETERSRERYLDLFDYAPVGYFTLDKNALILEANLTGAGLLGVERASLINKPLTSFIHKDDQDTFYFHRMQVLQTETQHSCEIKFTQPGGGWFHAKLQSVRMVDSEGGADRWRTAIWNITDRKLAQEAVQRAHDELENRVEERTHDLLKANKTLKVEIAERKKGEEALRRSEERYRQLFEKNRAIKLLVDQQTGAIVDANPSAVEFYGYRLDEMKQLKITDINILAAEQVAAAMTAAERGNIASFVFQHRLRSGEIRDVEDHSGPVDIQGRKLLYSIIHDITERRKAEDELKRSEQRLNLVLSGAGLGSWDYNLETGEAIYDRRLAKMLGFTLDEIPSDLLWLENLTHLDDWSRGMEMFNAHLEGRTPLYEAEFRIRPRLGDWKWILARGSVVERDKDGKPLRVSGTYLDVTERKRAEDALRVSEERFRAIFDGARDMIFIMNSNFEYTQVNPAMAKVLGLDVSEIIGQKPEEVYGEEVGRQLRLLDIRVLGGESIEREHTARIKGVSLTLNTILRPLHNAEGEIIGVFGISRDVTERSRAFPTPKASFESYPSEAMRATMLEARSAAASDGTVLLQGESGSGKDYLARWIHDHSKRALGPYFSLNCAAISRELAESELFGHERGSFTGAHRRKRGLLELAEGGTLLLNEIGELPLSLQSKLLTFLDTRSFLRVGGEKPINVNARIISATNRSLDKEVEDGRFLSALFYRINVFGITVPPLRDRIEDIPVLLEEIMSRLAAELQLTHLPYVDPAFAIALTRYDWPGNVREFRNALERALMLSDGHSLSLTLPSGKAGSEDWSHVCSFPLQERTLHDVTDEVIKSLILEALRRCGGNRRSSARTLGIARDSLYRYMKRFGIESENRTAGQDD